jgi:hypothetical protein
MEGSASLCSQTIRKKPLQHKDYPPNVALRLPQMWQELITAVIGAEVATGRWDR